MSAFQIIISATGFLLAGLLGVISFFLRNLFNVIKSIENKINSHAIVLAEVSIKMASFEMVQSELSQRVRTVERTQDKCGHCHEDK